MPPGCRNSSPDSAPPAGTSGRFRPCQWAPPPSLISYHLCLALTHPPDPLSWFESPQIDASESSPEATTAPPSPATLRHRHRKSLTSPIKLTSSPYSSAPHLGPHRLWELLQHRRRPHLAATSPEIAGTLGPWRAPLPLLIPPFDSDPSP
jgi:hypothetical protein